MVCETFLTKAQKKSPIMQEPYHIQVSLQKYYETFDEWPFPDFSDKCLICGAADCATYHGHYSRSVTCPLTNFSVSDFFILRYLCHGKGDVKEGDHVTFSLLPLELVPFRKLPLKFMVLAVWIRYSRHLSLTKTLDCIEDELNKLADIGDFINISTLMSWERLIRAGFDFFLSSEFKICNPQYEKITVDKSGMLLFLEELRKYESENADNPIRGPDAFAWDFYQQSGGADQHAFFLFGKASQHIN